MAKITFKDKVALNVNSDIADVNKCNATDLNEIKNVVNENDDNTTNNSNAIGNLSNLNTTNKSNLVNAINSVVESGSNTNGDYIKYSDGTMICTKKITFTNVVVDDAWGAVYSSKNTINFGDYAQEFIEIPNVSITLADGATCFCETFSERTKKSIGSTWLWKPVVEARGTMTFDVIAIGKWK